MTNETAYTLRDATPEDVTAIHEIVTEYVPEGLLLPRPVEDILQRIGNFMVAENEEGKVIACAALRDFGNSLYEIRSLAVRKALIAKGIGTALIKALIVRAKNKADHARVFALTYRVPFFTRMGFEIVDKQSFPEKIWADCRFCKNREQCGETAVAMEVSKE